MIVTSKFEIELAADPDSVAVPEIKVYQQEKYTRTVEFSLKENGENWMIPQNASCLIRYRRADGHGGVYSTLPDKTNAWHIEGNKLTLILVPQMMTAAGYVEASAVLLWSGEAITVSAFSLIVSRNPTADIIDSSDYFSFQNMDEINTALISLQTLLQTAMESEAFPGCYYRVVDGETEWINPPTVVGAEYRTTERWQDKVVYTKLVDCGAIVNGTKQIPHNVSAVQMLRCNGALSSGEWRTTMPYNDGAQTLNAHADVTNILLAGNFVGFRACAQIWYTKD